MKIATYNVNGVNGRLDVLLRWLEEGERIYTFWDYFRNAYGRDAGLRIDHFFFSARNYRAG